MTYQPLGNTIQHTNTQINFMGLGDTSKFENQQPLMQTWQTHGNMNQTLNLNNQSMLGFNRVMVIQNKYVELEATNRGLKEQLAAQDLEVRNLSTLLEK